MSESATEKTEESAEVKEIEEKIEETQEKIDEAKSDPEYATKEDVANLTTLLNEFREELKEAKAKKPVVPAPEKKEAKPEVKKETPKEEAKEEPKTEEVKTGYGSKRWFGNRW